jgi:hypothetical protein
MLTTSDGTTLKWTKLPAVNGSQIGPRYWANFWSTVDGTLWLAGGEESEL